MTIRQITSEYEWQATIRETGAMRVENIRAAKERGVIGAVWFETADFGWILSAQDERGARTILAQY